MLTPQDSVLSDAEVGLYREHKPFGFCLFSKHCENPDQLKKLCADLKKAVGDDCVIAIDQEGGRVARMRGPHWPEFPAAANMNDVYQTYFEIGTMLADHGITMNFAPCLDVVPHGARCDAIGDRCFSPDPKECGEKGIEACLGMIDAGVTPVIKHMPGHGRAEEDSHYFLPVVKANEKELQNDLKPFQSVCRHPELVSGSDALDSGLRRNDTFLFCGMTAHILFDKLDKEDPVTLSNTIIKNKIRNDIGFQGLLFSDDLAMKALDRYGDIVDRVRLALDAGCDVALPCHTTLDDSRKILESL
jgi:beta-N-acetylhexosaminidase